MSGCKAFADSSTTHIVEDILVDIPGLVLNLFALICLVQIVYDQKKNSTRASQTFKYLVVKTFADFAIFAIHVFDIRYQYSSQMQKSLAGIVWNLYFNNFSKNSLW